MTIDLNNKFSIRIRRVTIPWYSAVFFFFLLIGDRHGYTAVGLFFALLHEIGHIIAALICRVRIENVTLFPCGADMRLGSSMRSYLADAFIAGAGATMNIILALGIHFTEAFVSSADAVRLLNYSVGCNISLAVINLMPVRHLDGGNLISALLLCRHDPAVTEKTLGFLSLISLFVMWVAAVYILFVKDGSPSLFMLVCVMFASIFLRGNTLK